MTAPRMSALEQSAAAPAAFVLSADDQRTLARMFLQISHEDLQLLEHAVLGAEFDEVLHRVHRLHGAALTVGAASLAMELESFEKVLREALQIPTDSQARLSRVRLSLRGYQRDQRDGQRR